VDQFQRRLAIAALEFRFRLGVERIGVLALSQVDGAPRIAQRGAWSAEFRRLAQHQGAGRADEFADGSGGVVGDLPEQLQPASGSDGGIPPLPA